MKANTFIIATIIIGINLLSINAQDSINGSRQRVAIGFTLNTTSLDRGGGGIALDYYYSLSELWSIGIKSHYGFYGYENKLKENIQSNSIALYSSARCFLIGDVYFDVNAGIYHEQNELLRYHSHVLQNYFSHSFGFGYVLQYSPDIFAVIGIQSLFIRDTVLESIVERQFVFTVSILMNPFRKRI